MTKEAEAIILAKLDELTAKVDALTNAKPVEAPEYVGPEAVMDRYKISRGTLHNWIHKSGCPHELRGKILRFKLAEVAEWFGGRKLRRVK